MGSITSANAILMLTVPGVFATPQQLQQFGVDDIADIDEIEASETAMGVDGFLTGGYINVPVMVGFTFMADSPSPPLFDQWYAAQKGQLDTFPSNLTMVLKSIGTKWTFTRGFLRRYKPAPDAKKVLQARKFNIIFQSSSPSPT
jgi:hypothetical protein